MFYVGGAVVVGAAVHGNHSRHSEYDRHSRYGDSEVLNEISRKENAINSKASNVESLRQQMYNNFNQRIAQLKQEKNYSGLDAEHSDIVRSVKANMRQELDNEISRDKQELAEIDKMIARINELELQAKR